MTTLSGPMFEPSSGPVWRKVECRGYESGAHYSVFGLQHSDNAPVAEHGLRRLFPEGEANGMNFVLFSTSGVHGMYTTLEEIEASFAKYGDKPWSEDEDSPDDYCDGWLTFLVVHPRTVTLRYGNVKVTKENIEWLKKLRSTSRDVMTKIGWPD